MNKLAPRFSPLLAVTVVSLAAACGGNVVVDHGSTQGTGGAGASGGNHSTSTLSAMGGSTSDVSPVGPGPGPGVGPGPGSGGNSTTIVSVGPGPGPGPSSTSTGPQMCDCNLVCKDLVQCFPMIPQDTCVSACQGNQIPQGIMQCICSAGLDCNAQQQCVGMGPGTGPGPGTGTAIASVGPGPGTGTGGGGTGGGPPMACTDCANMAAQTDCGMQLQDCEQHQGCLDLINCEQGCQYDPMCVDGCKAQHGPNSNSRAQALLECAVCGQCAMSCANTDLFTVACTLPP